MRTFKTKAFAKFAQKEAISDSQLCKAIRAAELGLIDADLGGGVIKQRISRPNEGKSGGYRSIILFKIGARAFFVHGFAKSDAANITTTQLADFKILAASLLKAVDEQILALLAAKKLTEVLCDDEKPDL